MLRFRYRDICVAILLGVAACASYAQELFPSRQIRVVIGFAAGGGTDVVLRAIANKMGSDLGTTILVDNKPGANGNLAAETVAKSKGDGYTLLYNTSSLVTSPALYAGLPYNFRKDLMPIGIAANVPLVLVVSNSLGVSNVNDFVASAKAKRGGFSYASGGNGNITHLSNVLFQRATGVVAVHVPYKGESPAVADLVGGHVQFYMGTAAGVLPLVKDKKITALAVTSSKRLSNLPDVPTLTESGVLGVELGSWSGLMAPAGTPPQIIARLNKALNDALSDPALGATLMTHSAEIKSGTPGEYGAYLEAENQRWGALIKAQKIVAD